METYERALVITWLLKDFGWMTTNVYLAIPAGICSVLAHLFLIFFDPRKNFFLYNISLSCWVTGNFIWMSTEFMYEHNNKEVHWGPDTPIGGPWSADGLKKMTDAKLALFSLGVIGQVVLYLLLWTRRISMPVDYGEDIVALNEIQLLCKGKTKSGGSGAGHSYGSAGNGLDEDNQLEFDNPYGANTFGGLTVAYVENFYILFWVSKDLFWSWGTGDPPVGRAPIPPVEGLIEALAICFACVCILNYILTSYIHRRDGVVLIDCLSAVCWIVANFIWMCGEFFVRFENNTLDDDTQGDDYHTRIASACFFLLGILLQSYIVTRLTLRKWSGQTDESVMTSGVYAGTPLEVFAFAPVTSYSPQKLARDEEDANVELVMF